MSCHQCQNRRFSPLESADIAPLSSAEEGGRLRARLERNDGAILSSQLRDVTEQQHPSPSLSQSTAGHAVRFPTTLPQPRQHRGGWSGNFRLPN